MPAIDSEFVVADFNREDIRARGGDIKVQVNTIPGDTNPSDNDVHWAKSRLHIRMDHAGRLTDPKHETPDSDGIRSGTGLSYTVRNLVWRYRFVRIGPELVERWDNGVLDATFGPPGSTGPGPEPHNANNQHMYVSEVVKRKTSAGQTFGAAGAEQWFGGRKDWGNHTKMDTVWTHIETHTPHLESNYLYAPVSIITQKKYLILPVNDLTEQEAADLVAPVMDLQGTPTSATVNSVVSTGDEHDVTLASAIDLDDPDITYLRDLNSNFYEIDKDNSTSTVLKVYNAIAPVTGAGDLGRYAAVKYRARRIVWRNLRNMSSGRISEVLDRKKVSDYRQVDPDTIHQAVVEVKP